MRAWNDVTERVEEVPTQEYWEQVTRVLSELMSSTEDDVAPAPGAVARAYFDLMRSARNASNEMAARVAPFWSSAKVRQELRVPTRQALESRIRSGGVLALRTADSGNARRLLFPVFQFERTDNGVRVRPGLVDWLRTLRDHDSWSVALLATAPFDELDGQSPLEWARSQGDPERLTALGRQVHRQWAM